jgi:peptide/nickel transport system permease protein
VHIASLCLRRAGTAFLTLVLVSLIIFVAVEVIPGDAATRVAGRDATPETLEVLRERMNLDLPPAERYLTWLGNALVGEFGQVLTSGRPVAEILAPRVKNTLIMSAMAFALYFPLVLIPAIYQAVRRDRAADHALSSITLILLSIPDFVLATFLLLLFAVAIPLFPAMSTIDEGTSLIDILHVSVLPAVTLAVVMAVYAVRMLREGLIEILEADFVRMARLKGLGQRRVLLRHALPNAVIPTLNVTALNLAYLIGGVVVVERVYSFPGFGSLIVDSLKLLDAPLIQATVLLAAAVYIGANLAVDIVAILLNPRLRKG